MPEQTPDIAADIAVDIAVIGASPAGQAIAAAAAQLGLAVALVEPGRMGAGSLHAGPVPRQALLAAARAATAAREATRFGLAASLAPTDWPAIWDRVHATIAALAPTVGAARLRALGADVIEGNASFLDRKRLVVRARGRERILRPRRIVIATGRSPTLPPVPGLARILAPEGAGEGAGAMTQADYVAARPAPGHLLILGDTAAAIEMAAAHAGLGCAVTLVAPGRFAAAEDPELALGLALALRRQGVELIEHAAVARAEPGPALILADGRRLAATHLLVAAGTAPALASLNPRAANLAVTPGGIATDRSLRCRGNRRVFAVGAVAAPPGVGREATDPTDLPQMETEHAAVFLRRAVLRLPARLPGTIPRMLCTCPELAQAGMTEEQARAAGHDVRVLRWPLADNDRAVAERRPEGLVKLVLSRHGRLLGAGILAPHASETIGLLALAVGRRLGASALASLALPSPTHAEAVKRAAGTFHASLAASPWLRRAVRLLASLPS